MFFEEDREKRISCEFGIESCYVEGYLIDVWVNEAIYFEAAVFDIKNRIMVKEVKLYGFNFNNWGDGLSEEVIDEILRCTYEISSRITSEHYKASRNSGVERLKLIGCLEIVGEMK